MEHRTDNKKNSFQVYLDTYFHLTRLPLEERGALFTNLMWYARQTADREDLGMDVIYAAAQAPEPMAPATRMAFCFMADTIQRDTLRWYEKRDNYRKSARRREERRRAGNMPFQGRGVDVWPDSRELQALLPPEDDWPEGDIPIRAIQPEE